MLVASNPIAPYAPAIAHVSGDAELIDLWLHGKSPNTQEAYRRDIAYFLAFIDGKPLQNVTLNDIQSFDTALRQKGYSDGTVKRRMNAVKSLLKYGSQLGVLAVNAALPFKVPKGKEMLSERILTESQVQSMLHLEKLSQRDRLILKFLYASGCRVSELVSLTWENCQTLDDGKGKITIFGKGGKTRTVLVSVELWANVLTLQSGRSLKDAMFYSRTGRALTRVQINRIVATARSLAKIPQEASPHWFRHAHASHSLKHGAPLNLVQKTLGHARIDTTAVYLHADPDDSSGLHLSV